METVLLAQNRLKLLKSGNLRQKNLLEFSTAAIKIASYLHICICNCSVRASTIVVQL